MAIIAEVKRRAASAVFPRFCVRCGNEGELLCAWCRSEWRGTSTPPFAYADPVVRGLLVAWKYKFDVTAFAALRAITLPRLGAWSDRVRREHIDALVPMPLSAMRQRERGFNQADEIAHWLSALWQIPTLPLLVKYESFGHQAERTPLERQRAMHSDLFGIRANVLIPERVLLVDDVLTTGATMRAATAVLREAGVKDVLPFCIAKGQ